MRILSFSSCVAIALLMSGCSGPEPAAEDFIDSSFVTAVLVHPQQIQEMPNFDSIRTMINAAGGAQIEELKKATNIDPFKIQRVLIVMGPDAEADAAAIVQFGDAVNVGEINKTLPPNVKTATHNGKDYYQFGMPGSEQAAHFATSKTLLFGTESAVKKMLDAKPGDSPLKKLLAGADASKDISIVASTSAIGSLAAQIPGAAAPEQAEMFKKVNSVQVELDLSSDEFVRAVITFDSAETADMVSAMTHAGLKEVKEAMNSPEAAAAGPAAMMPGPMADIGKELANGATIEQSGEVLTVRLARPSALDNIQELIGGVMAMAMGMQGGGGLPAPDAGPGPGFGPGEPADVPAAEPAEEPAGEPAE